MKRGAGFARLAGLAVLASCALAPAADAAQIGMSYEDPPGNRYVAFMATPGENNNVEVEVSGGGDVVTIRDTGGAFLPARTPNTTEDCEIVDLHTAVCTQSDIEFVNIALDDGVNTYRVAPGSEKFKGAVYAYGVGDQIDAGGMWAGGIWEGGVQANLVLGDQNGAPGSVVLAGPSTGTRVDVQNGAPSDNVGCDNGWSTPASVKSDSGDYLGPGCPGQSVPSPRPFPQPPVHYLPHASPIWLP